MMKRKIRSEEQIIDILPDHEAGAKRADLCRKDGMSEGEVFRDDAAQAKQLKALKDDNAKLTRLLAVP